MRDEERAEWLAGLKAGDEIMEWDDHAPPSTCLVAFVDHSRIFYSPAGEPSDNPDWAWLDNGHAALNTSRHRWIEPMPSAAQDSRLGGVEAS